MKKFLLTLALGATVSGASALAEAPFSIDTIPGRLPKQVRPDAYRIDMIPDMTALTLKGREEIDLTVTASVDKFVLDQAGLTVAKAWLKGDESHPAAVKADDKAQTVTLGWSHPVAAGTHTLIVDYRGPIPESPAGLYYDDYQNGAAQARMLITQFEAIDARRMFPGWDEPAFKATFQLTATVPDGLAAISNMPVSSEKPAGSDAHGHKLKRVEFAATPKMSSYLLALAVGSMERLAGKSGATDIGVWTVTGKSADGAYALKAEEQILPFYNEYFGVTYPLPKLDLIAVPGNFTAGAMENWGAITFIDDDLLYNPKSSTPMTREEVYSTVAHEMAHQWSGDLVTMGWWDNLWLNEGFADWMQNNATDRFNPDWQVWLRAREEKERAMAIDAKRTTHPLQQRVDDESQIDGEFDDISYVKGASVIRMIENWLGPDKFRDGMRRYMKAHAYSNTTAADLWAAQSEASGQPVAAVASTFTEQPGLPLVHVKTSCADGKTTVTLSQERFTLHDPQAAKLTWRIPVRLGAGAETQAVLLPPEGAGASFTGCNAAVQANLGDVGYYRVAYDDANLAKLTAGFASLSPADRTVLLGDQWALVESGQAEIASYLNLMKSLAGETQVAVWTPVIHDLDVLDRITRTSPDKALFRSYAAGVLRLPLARLGWDPKPNESYADALLRSELITSLGQFDDPNVIAEARRRFAAFEQNPASLAPSISDAVIETVARTADKATWERMRALGRAASDSETKLRYYFAMAAARDPALIDALVGIALTNEVPPGRINRVLQGAAGESEAPERVWQGVLAHAAPIMKNLTAGDRGEMLAEIAEATDDPKIGAELAARPEMKDTEGARLLAARAVENIAIANDLKQRLLPALGAWLRTNGGK